MDDLLKIIQRDPNWKPSEKAKTAAKRNADFMKKLKEEGRLAEFFEKMDREITEEDLDDLFVLRK